MLDAYAIVIRDHPVSEAGFAKLVASSKAVGNQFEIQRFDATTPNFDDNEWPKWNWPWDREEYNIASGLTKRPYPTNNKRARIACAISHYRLWQIATKRPALILEHDAEFIQKFDVAKLAFNGSILGINDPLNATRRANVYARAVQSADSHLHYEDAPWVDEDASIPQGLAGNSAYLMLPDGAFQMLALVAKYGLWPNDAIMCRQLIDGLYQTRTYYTRVQGLRSTTSK